MTVELVRASAEKHLLAVERAVARLLAAVRDDSAGCRWCLAREMLVSFYEYAEARPLPPSTIKDWEARVAGVLKTEPGRTECRRCLHARRVARYEGGGCAAHACCRTHMSKFVPIWARTVH